MPDIDLIRPPMTDADAATFQVDLERVARKYGIDPAAFADDEDLREAISRVTGLPPWEAVQAVVYGHNYPVLPR